MLKALLQYCSLRGVAFPRNQDQAEVVFYELGSDLADEIVWRDGEASEREAKEWYNHHVKLIHQLLDLGYIVKGRALVETDIFFTYGAKVPPLWVGGETWAN